jgi:hypothetical protein
MTSAQSHGEYHEARTVMRAENLGQAEKPLQMTAREGAATHRIGWVSKCDLLGCTRPRSVPSLRVRKEIE